MLHNVERKAEISFIAVTNSIKDFLSLDECAVLIFMFDHHINAIKISRQLDMHARPINKMLLFYLWKVRGTSVNSTVLVP